MQGIIWHIHDVEWHGDYAIGPSVPLYSSSSSSLSIALKILHPSALLLDALPLSRTLWNIRIFAKPHRLSHCKDSFGYSFLLLLSLAVFSLSPFLFSPHLSLSLFCIHLSFLSLVLLKETHPCCCCCCYIFPTCSSSHRHRRRHRWRRPTKINNSLWLSLRVEQSVIDG